MLRAGSGAGRRVAMSVTSRRVVSTLAQVRNAYFVTFPTKIGRSLPINLPTLASRGRRFRKGGRPRRPRPVFRPAFQTPRPPRHERCPESRRRRRAGPVAAPGPARDAAAQDASTAFKVLGAISVAHLMNDMIQSILLAIYPMLKEGFSLSFSQIGLITLVYQLAARCCSPSSGCTPTATPSRIRCRWAWASRWPACCCCRWRRPSAGCWWRRCWWAQARRCSIPSPRAWRAWPRAAATAWRNRCSRLVATSARRWGRCWRRCSSFRTGSAAWPGSRWRRCSASWC